MRTGKMNHIPVFQTVTVKGYSLCYNLAKREQVGYRKTLFML